MLSLSMIGCRVDVSSTDSFVQSLLAACYGHMAVSTTSCADIFVNVGSLPNYRGFYINRDGQYQEAGSVSDLLYKFEKELTIQFQYKHPELYFVHAAVLALDDRAVLLAAPSGTGKSTTTFALLHENFRYLSDELAPVDLDALTIEPYPHALCLKSDPPQPYRLPAGVIRTDSTLHVPVNTMPTTACNEKVKLDAIFFLDREHGRLKGASRIDPGESAARLYANALNNLAHSGEGLDAAIRLTSQVPCYVLNVRDLTGVGREIRKVLVS